MILALEEKQPGKTVKGGDSAARLSSLETEIIDFFVQLSRLLGHPCKIYNFLGVAAPVLHIGPRPSHLSEMLDAIKSEYPCASVAHGKVDRMVQQIESVRRQPGLTSRQTPTHTRTLFFKETLLPRLIGELESG